MGQPKLPLIQTARRDAAIREQLLWSVRHAGERLKGIDQLAPLVTAVSRRLVGHELRRLHDVLAATPLADRYWLWSGALLGWAREGRILAHDTADVDFGYFAADGDLLRSSLPALERAGFALYRVLRNNEGTLTGVVLIRSGIHFDFLAFFPAGASRHVYSVFEGFQIIEAVPAQELERFTFCRRRWLKAADHERELTALYGDWRTPRPDWDTVRDSPAIVSRAAYIPRPCDPFDVSDHVAHV